MAKWIPGVATFGLICLMVLPAPGIWGLLIGVICVVAIVGSTLFWMLDEMLSRVLSGYGRWRNRRRPSSRSTGHAASRLANKAPAKKPAGKRA